MSPPIILEAVKMSKHYNVPAESELGRRRRRQLDWGMLGAFAKLPLGERGCMYTLLCLLEETKAQLMDKTGWDLVVLYTPSYED